jgi:16S rRNA (guanine527-N7)-methyltransferase
MSSASHPRPDATPPDAAEAAGALARFSFVTPEIRRDLERFVGLLREWQQTHNLVSRTDLDVIWDRHVADSLQLIEHAPDGWREWVDLGSGAGFPGLVVAIAMKGTGRVETSVPLSRPSADAEGHPLPRGERVKLPHVTLVESNLKKAAFLRAAIRESGANASVAAERIEEHGPKMAGQADVVSARALAPLPALCALAQPYLREGSVLLLLKGQDFVHEHEAASKAWDYDMVNNSSVTNPAGLVVAMRKLRRKERA